MEDMGAKFEELYTEFHEDIYKYALSYTLNLYDAEELTQEAFTRLWERWSVLCSNRPVQNKVWLIRAISNIAKEKYRASKRSKAEDLLEMADFIAYDDNIEQKIEELQYKSYCVDIKNDLKPNEAEIVELLEKDMTYSEMSEKLGKREVTIRSTVSRMRTRLRGKYEELMKK